MKSDWAIMTIWVALAVGTAAIIRWTYDLEQLIGVQYATACIVLTMITWLWAWNFASRTDASLNSLDLAIVYALVLMPMNYILAVPPSLVEFNRSAMQWVVLWHGLGFALLYRLEKREFTGP